MAMNSHALTASREDASPRTRVSTGGPHYPTDFDGASSTTAGNSSIAGAGIVVHGITVETATVLGLITLEDHAGNDLLTFLPAAAGMYTFPRGIFSAAGLRITAAGTALQITVHWSLA